MRTIENEFLITLICGVRVKATIGCLDNHDHMPAAGSKATSLAFLQQIQLVVHATLCYTVHRNLTIHPAPQERH